MYPKQIRTRVLTQVAEGFPISDVADQEHIPARTIHRWIKQYGLPELGTEPTIDNIKKQLAKLSKCRQTVAVAHKIAMLTNSLTKLETLHQREEKKRIAKRRKPRLKCLGEEEVKALRDKALSDDYGLYGYQKSFMASDAQFRLVLKARQIGFSYVAGLDALIMAAAGRSQLFLSASEEQSIILMRYVTMHAKRLGILVEGGDKELKLESGAVIKAMAHNFRTVQGFTGDIWMDEFAWYPNPKRIWHAFVPSIGAIQGRLTIMSTPFERAGLFHDLFADEDRYYMFDRWKITIHDAIKDGLTFDLETMKALFDSDTWASAYECQFVDDETALLTIDLIKSCVDPSLIYHLPPSKALLYCGYDIGRVKDSSALATLQVPPPATGSTASTPFTLTGLDVLRKASFDTQETVIKHHLNMYPQAFIRIDRTGMGMQLAERMHTRFKGRAKGIHFTQSSKEFLALNLKKLFEDRLIRIPNDPHLIADIHAIKRKAGARSFTYDADRNEHGHADRFWALALAASHIDHLVERRKGKAWVL